MHDALQPHDAGSATGDRSGILTGRPTVAGNNGSEIPSKLLRAFAAANSSTAEWVRLPSTRARCRLCGLSRTTLNEAVERGDIRAITIRQAGAIRGIKLIHRQSLLDWLSRLDAEQNGACVRDPAGALRGGEQ